MDERTEEAWLMEARDDWDAVRGCMRSKGLSFVNSDSRDWSLVCVSRSWIYKAISRHTAC